MTAMTNHDRTAPLTETVLTGRRAWLITDGKAGSESQASGIARALGLDFEAKRVAPRGLYKFIAPFGPVMPAARFGEPGSQFAPPWPEIVIGIGRRSVPYLKAVRRAAPHCFTVHLLDAKAGTAFAHMIWVPEHDRLRGETVVTTPTAPHSFSSERLAELRTNTPPDIAALPSPRIAVLLGGRNAVYRFDAADHARFSDSLALFATRGCSFMITSSRRTHTELLHAARTATAAAPRIIYDGRGDNRYADFLAHAHRIIVTGDSVSMTAEAAATGAPVFVFHPSRGSAKFDRFHRALERAGVTKALDTQSASEPAWRYHPIDSTAQIAQAIVSRWQCFHRQMKR